MVLAYGGYNLQLGDSDPKRIYGGKESSEPGEQGYVRQLQEDLEKLGFNFFSSSPKSGEFDLKTEWAVREFQIYAQMPFVAKVKTNPPTTQRYVDTLEQTQNTEQYKGSISGVANPVTRELIQHWLGNNWRCPVVVEVWTWHGYACEIFCLHLGQKRQIQMVVEAIAALQLAIFILQKKQLLSCCAIIFGDLVL